MNDLTFWFWFLVVFGVSFVAVFFAMLGIKLIDDDAEEKERKEERKKHRID